MVWICTASSALTFCTAGDLNPSSDGEGIVPPRAGPSSANRFHNELSLFEKIELQLGGQLFKKFLYTNRTKLS